VRPAVSGLVATMTRADGNRKIAAGNGWSQSSLYQGSVWNHLKRRFFLLHPAAVLNIDGLRIPDGLAVRMIVCSCNVLSDHDVRSAVSAADDLPRNAKQIYGCLGCSAECGRCARTIKTIIDEALGACAKACCSGCPHSQAGVEPDVHAEFALAAS
jgi:bacterioferritin-associated ferredoxin